MDLTQGAILPKLIMFALPTMGGNIIQTLNGTANGIWVGRLMEENALAATTSVNIVMFLAVSALFGFSMATTVLVGQSMGRKDIDGVRRTVGTSFTLFLLASLVIALLGWVGAPWLLHQLSTPQEALPFALGYCKIIFLSMPPMFLMTLAMMSLRGVGNSLTPLWWMILSVVIDSGLNPFLIAGYGPFPKMGTEGAALATVIANYIACAGLFLHIYSQDLPIRLRGDELAYLKPNKALARTIITKGLPMSLQMFVIAGSGTVMMGLINREGVTTAAAFSAVMQLWNYVMMPLMAVGASVSAFCAQNIGAGKWERIGHITRAGIALNLGITIVLVLLLILFGQPPLLLFLHSGSPSVAIADHIQLMATWSYIPLSVTFILLAVMRANGDVWSALYIMAISLFGIRLASAFLLLPHMGANALWLASPISTTASMLLASAYYATGRWKKARMQR